MIGREREFKEASEFLDPTQVRDSARLLLVRGESGNGKSYFTKTLLNDLAAKDAGNCLALYFDVANDEFQSARIIEAILKQCSVEAQATAEFPLNIPRDSTYTRFKRVVEKGRESRSILLKVVVNAVFNALGLGSALAQETSPISSATLFSNDELFKYLKWATKEKTVYVVIDNVQFLSIGTRLEVESCLYRLETGLAYVAIERLVEGASVMSGAITCFSDARKEISLAPFTFEETHAYVRQSLDPVQTGIDLEVLAQDIYEKTGGVAKDVAFCLRSISLQASSNPEAQGVLGLVATIDRLPLMQRQFLLIVSLLDGGVKPEVARSVVARLAAQADADEIDATLERLVRTDYLQVTPDEAHRLRAGHERIIRAMRDTVGMEEQEVVRRSLIEEFERALSSKPRIDDELYLLHCLIGLQTAKELSDNIHQVSNLLIRQYNADQFSYIISLYEEISEIAPLLPADTLRLVLDSAQKSSAFDRGLVVLRQMQHMADVTDQDVALYEVKFFTQQYRYEEALRACERLTEGAWTDVYMLNIHLARSDVEAARAIADAHPPSAAADEARAVIWRNSVTLYDRREAAARLERARTYFVRRDSQFRLAATENNAALLDLINGDIEAAGRHLDRAEKMMARIGTREIYQCHINLGLRDALLGRYTSALKRMESALERTPNALLLDQVKVELNIAVLRFAAGSANRESLIIALKDALARIRGVEMPYLRAALHHNLHVGRMIAGEGDSEAPSDDLLRPMADSRLAFFVEAPDRPAQSFALLSSVHWRY